MNCLLSTLRNTSTFSISISIRIYIYIRANDSSAPTKSAQCQGRAKLLMKLFKKQANFVLPMVSCYKTIIRHAKLL